MTDGKTGRKDMSEEKDENVHGEYWNLCEEIKTLESKNAHLMANNADLTKRNAMLRERPDLPVDRIPQTERYEAEIKSLESKLSTLLKASEGMEKALENTLENSEIYALEFQREFDHPRNRNQIEGNFRIVLEAKQALADFRAVKEGKV